MSNYLMQGRFLRRPLLGAGIQYPFEFSTRTGSTLRGVATSYDTDRINQGLWQLLSTRCAVGDTPGEDDSLPTYGSQLYALLYRRIGYETKPLIMAYVVDAIATWEKRITLRDVSFLSDALSYVRGTPGTIPATALANLEKIAAGIEAVDLQYTVIESQVAGNCVFPFYTASDLTLQGYGYNFYGVQKVTA
jgi:phage baseplate assembly protein W